jgi:hypothetical protein
MKAFSLVIIFLFNFGLSQVLANELSAEDKKELLRIYRPHLREGRYASATHGILRQIVMGQPLKGNDQRLKKLQIPAGKNKDFDITVRHFIQPQKSDFDRRPLVVLVNPLFSTFAMRQMQATAHYFIQAGAHVLEFENTWTTDYAKNKKYPFIPGDMWNEAKLQLEVMHSFLNENLGGEKQVSQVILIGASYGSFLAAAMKAYDSMSEKPLILGPTLLLSPPHDILNSLKNLDRQHNEVLEDKSSRSCFLPQRFFSILKRGLFTRDFNQKPLDEKCAKNFLVRIGFFGQLKKIVNLLNKTKNLDLSEEAINNISFESYVKDIAKLKPSTQFPEEETNIGYWMSLSKNHSYDRFIVVTTKDDNINEGLNFAENLYYDFTNSNTIILPTGGHLGYAGVELENSTWMQELLNKIKLFSL